MICRCPECGKFAAGEVKFRQYVSNQMGRGFERGFIGVLSIGSQEVNDAKKWFRNKLGNKIGGMLGMTVDVTRDTVAAQVGLVKGILDGVGEVISRDYTENECFTCEACKHKWSVEKNEAKDCTDEFYEECYDNFRKKEGIRYLVVDPKATGVYDNTTNFFLLRKVPEEIKLPENTILHGEIYVRHPAHPETFYALKSSYKKILQNELDDLKLLFYGLGAASGYIKARVAVEKEIYDKSSISGELNVGHVKGVSGKVAAMREQEAESCEQEEWEYDTELKGEKQEQPHVELEPYERWHTVRDKWDKILIQRKNGEREYKLTIKSKQFYNKQRRELDKVEAAYSQIALSANAKVDYEIINRIKESNRLGIYIKVKYFPLKDYANREIENYPSDLLPEKQKNAVVDRQRKIGTVRVWVIVSAVLLALCACCVFYIFGLH